MYKYALVAGSKFLFFYFFHLWFRKHSIHAIPVCNFRMLQKQKKEKNSECQINVRAT